MHVVIRVDVVNIVAFLVFRVVGLFQQFHKKGWSASLEPETAERAFAEGREQAEGIIRVSCPPR